MCGFGLACSWRCREGQFGYDSESLIICSARGCCAMYNGSTLWVPQPHPFQAKILSLLPNSSSTAITALQRLLDSWYPLWTLLFQPALGVLMLGAVGYSSTKLSWKNRCCLFVVIGPELVTGTVAARMHCSCMRELTNGVFHACALCTNCLEHQCSIPIALLSSCLHDMLGALVYYCCRTYVAQYMYVGLKLLDT